MKRVIVLSSITYALKSQDLLKSNGIFSKITRSKSVKSVRGCGYGIVVDSVVAERSENLLASSGIPIVGSIDEK